MSWFKRALPIQVEDINSHVLKAIKLIVGGDVNWKNFRSHQVPKYQKYGSTDISLKNVIKKGDLFDISIIHIVKRRHNQDETPSGSEFYRNNFMQEWIKNNPIQPVEQMDSEIGHSLVKFHVVINGKKPDDEDMVRIADYRYLDTPYEVAEFVKNAIDRFYRPGGDNKEENIPVPDPSSFVPSPEPVGVMT